MNRFFKSLLLASLCVVVSCDDSDDGSPQQGGSNPDDPFSNPSAEYIVTINTDFSEENFPQEYPDNAQFGPVIIVAHAPDVSVFQIGQVASEALEEYVENGDSGILASALTAGSEGVENTTSVSVESAVAAVGSSSFSINVTPTNTRITVLARLNPSPDWFVAINSFNVIDGNELVDQETQNLVAFDAGTDAGTTYTSEDQEESNQVSVIDTPPLLAGGLGAILGTVTFEKN